MKLKRYEWTDVISNFETQIGNLFANDPFWTIRKFQGSSWDNWGVVEFENKKKPEMTFTIAVFDQSYAPVFRFGMGTDYTSGRSNWKPNVYTQIGVLSEVPLNNATGNYNTNYNWTVFTSEDYIYIHTDNGNYAGSSVPIRIFMGLMTPYENEDPAIAGNFWGIMPMMPMGVNDSNWGNYSYNNVGRGVVYRSRNNSIFPYYQFETSSQLPSPGVGGKYYISPFYVYEPNEGVRGEFGRVYTAVLKDGTQYPDGSTLKVNGRTYYVFHVGNHYFPDYPYWYHSNNVNYYKRPYFFDSCYLAGGGQRVMLFDITEGVA